MATHPAELVWRRASDGHWHTRRDFEEQLPLGRKRIKKALDFLVKYGFVQSRAMSEVRFKAIAGAPSPMEAVEGLLGLFDAGTFF